jgi:hypothetical protein
MACLGERAHCASLSKRFPRRLCGPPAHHDGPGELLRVHRRQRSAPRRCGAHGSWPDCIAAAKSDAMCAFTILVVAHLAADHEDRRPDAQGPAAQPADWHDSGQRRTFRQSVSQSRRISSRSAPAMPALSPRPDNSTATRSG